MSWCGPHRHYWSYSDEDLVRPDKGSMPTAIIKTSKCSCGSFRYDKLDHTGWVSTTIGDTNGVKQS